MFRTNHFDVPVVAILGVAFGLAFVAVQFGISVAADASFAGVLVAESEPRNCKGLVHAAQGHVRGPFLRVFRSFNRISKLPLFIIPALVFVATSFAAKFSTVYLSARSQFINNKKSIQTAFGSSASGGSLRW
ncbi:MAG TPA: hypothetical protein VNI77_06165 [Nitrososphaera sp.]|nr:hypothetical protein [Nitrososphaera sp.]